MFIISTNCFLKAFFRQICLAPELASGKFDGKVERIFAAGAKISVF